MSYQGDSSLSVDIQDRVVNTFDQTARLAQAGKLQEAQLGCDFILRLDPHFEPARMLQGRLDGAEGPIDLSDIQPAPEPVATPEVLKTVALSPEEIEKLMAAEDAEVNGSGPADVPAPAEAAPEAPPSDREATAGPAVVSDAAQPATEAALPTAAQPAAEAAVPTTVQPAAEAAVPTAAQAAVSAAASEPPAPRKPIGKVQIGRAADPVGASEVAEPSADGPAIDLGSADRIRKLIDEGQAAYDEEKYQEAIDSWSRIFLIDIDHEDATRRIDLARQLKEEREREVEELFHEGAAHADEGRTALAVETFEKLLAIQPSHLAAREFLDRLSDTEPDPAAHEEEPSQPPPREAAPPVAAPDDGTAEPLSPHEGSSGAPRAADESFRMVARAKRPPVSRTVLIGSGVAVLVAVAAILLFSNWGRLFPNSSEPDPVPQRGQLIDRITQIYERGEIAAAIAAAGEIGADNPDFLRAQRLVAKWQEELAAAQEEGLSTEAASAQADLVSAAREAYGEGRYLQAARNFTRASSIAPLSAAEAALFEDAKQQLEPIAQQIDLYNQRQWELALPPLWRRLEQDADNLDVQELLTNSYFNMAVRDLRRGNPRAALKSIAEAERLRTDDEELARIKSFASTYAQLPRDLLYEIFVQQLDFRR